MDAALAELCKQTVTVQARTGSNSYGEASYSTSVTTYTQCRVVPMAREVRDLNGNTVLSSYVAWINTATTHSPESKFTLPGSVVRPVLTVEAPVDENGLVDHLKVTFGW